MKKVVAIVVALGILGALGWQIYRKATGAEGPPERKALPTPVEAAPLRVASIRDVGRFTGALSANSQFIVAPKIAGRLKRILVDVGDSVEPGKLVAVLDDEEYAQQVDQARAELEVAKASVAECRSNLDLASRQYERDAALREKKISSESELDESQARFKVAEAKHLVAQAQVRQREASLEVAKVRLSYTQVQASWQEGGSGSRLIAERFVDEGATLRANDPIVLVVDIDTLKALIHVTERDYTKIKPKQAVSIVTDAYPGQAFTGAVTRVAPILREASRQARIEIEVPNPDRLLKPGMFIWASIEFAARPEAVVVPVDGIVWRDGRRGVFVADPASKTARFVPIETGIIDGDLAELKSAGGETAVVDPAKPLLVVTLGQPLLEDGAAISLPEAKQPERKPDEPAAVPAREGAR